MNHLTNLYMPKILAKEDDFAITYHKCHDLSLGVIVTFDNISFGIREKGFGTDFALKSGFDNIYVSQKKNSQYQGLSVDTFHDIVSPFTLGRKVFSYGSSLGAYAALYFGGCINAKIIASAPKNSAHPSVGASRFKQLSYKHLELVEAPTSSQRPLVLFDPYRREDVKFIDTCVRPAYPHADYREYPFAGHTVLETIQSNGLLGEFTRGIFLEDRVPEISLKKDGCHIYHCEIGRNFRLKGKNSEAEYNLSTSLKIKFTSTALENLMHLYMKQGRSRELLNLCMNFIEEAAVDRKGGLVSAYMKSLILKHGFSWDDFVAQTSKQTE